MTRAPPSALALLFLDTVDALAAAVEIEAVAGDEFEVGGVVPQCVEFPVLLPLVSPHMVFLGVGAGKLFLECVELAHLRDGKAMATQVVRSSRVKAARLTMRIPAVRARRCCPTGCRRLFLAEGERLAIHPEDSNFY